MKKFKYLTLLSIAVISLFMVGCDATNKTLNDLDQAIGKIEAVTVQSDYQEVIDLENTDVKSEYMSFIEMDLDPLQEFAELRTSFLENHLLLQEQRMTFQSNKEELRTLIKLFRDSQLQLTDEDKVLILEKIELFKGYRQEFLDTKGLAYLRIYNLKGQYKIEDIDIINQTIGEVNEVLLLRIELFEKTNQDIMEVIAILEEYTEI
jgi:hypothetical protein